ncbi:rhomboid family intramembrane serine protease [Arcticibacter tournemirensis]|uniref:Rhomboid family intramembrane serine protease n=1 Tax=Arcticibacter tournemirensis TaxID=699437 RepID=A0A4Q0MC36_9SPHI|nr:rhomboid family intramembrane serine protease [Arcticibacter tournemirensis]
MFTHEGVIHLLFNMYGLLFVGGSWNPCWGT